MDRYRVSLRIQSECGKIRIRITPNTDTFHAVDDKRQITRTFVSIFQASFYQFHSGITDRCQPKVKFSSSFHITHSSNHWSNDLIVMDYLKKIFFPTLGKNAKMWNWRKMQRSYWYSMSLKAKLPAR